MKKTIYAFIFAIILSALGGVILVRAQVFNPEINYQGKLANSSNSTVSDGSYGMQFSLYTSISGGSPIWTETWCDTSTCDGNGGGYDNRIKVTSGLFSVMLGSTTAFTGVNFNQPLYLGVTIGGPNASTSWDGEMSPRKIIGAVPAAFFSATSTIALSANALSGLSSSEFLRSDAQNATSSTNTFLSVLQSGVGKVAEFFSSATQSVLALLSNGNVGIGTTSPFARLSVAGAAAGTTALFSVSTSTATFATTTAVTIDQNGNLALLNGANATITGNSTVSGTASSSNAVVSNSFTLGNMNGVLWGTNGAVSTVSTSSLGLLSFSTTSAAYWQIQNNFFSTTSAAYWQTQNNFFSTTSANYWLTQNIGNAFSTTSSNYWLTQNQGNAFSSTSANYWLTQNTGNAFSTTSSNYWLTLNQGNAYSTTSAAYWLTQQTVAVANGGTGQTSFGQGWLGINNSGAFISSTSPTVNYFTATSTTATSTIGTGGFAVDGNYFLVQQGSGNVGIGTSSPFAMLSVQGNSFIAGNETASNFIATSTAASSTLQNLTANQVAATYFIATSTTATSTFANGINLTKGCYAVNSTCLSTGGSSASSTLLSNNNTFSGINRFTNTTSSGGLFMPGGAYVASFAGGTWINLPTSGASGIGTGGPGSNPFLAYSASGGQWFSNAQTGDENFRNTSGNMNFGVQQANYDMSLRASSHILQLGMNGGDVGVATATPSYPFSVQGTSYFDNTTGMNDPSLVAVGSQPVNVPNPTGTLFASINEDSGCTDRGGSYINGSITYKLWAYRYNLGGTKIYSPNYITNTISDFSGNSFCGELSWTDVGADGYILEINSSVESGFNGIGYTNMGNITSYEDIGQGADVGGAFPDSPTSSIIPSAIFMGGNVGIGTTSPFSNLSVSTAAQQSGSMPLFTIASTTNANLFTVLGNGNVGIGTTTPWTNLSVNGSSDLGNFALAGYFNATNTAATSTFAGGVDIGNGSLKFDVGAGVTSISNLQLGNISFDTDAGVVSWMDLPVDANVAGGVAESYSASVGGNPLLTIYSQANGLGGIQNGAVGIGTTSPFAMLSVQGNSFIAGNETASNFIATSTAASSTLQNLTANQVAATYFIATSSTASSFPYASTTMITAATASTTNLIVSGLNGPLQAISGVVSATSTLSIGYGGTGLQAAPSYGKLLLGNASSGYSLVSTSSLGLLGSSTVSSLSNNYLSKWNSNGTFANSLLYDNGTNVGIGTTSPWTNLSVNGSSDLGYFALAGYFNATNTAATSTFAGNALFGGNVSITNLFASAANFTSAIFGSATSTNFFSTTASSTNLFSSIASLGSLNVSGNTTLATSLTGFLQATNGLISATTSPSINALSGILGVANGGTGSSTLTSNGILYGNGIGSIQATAAGTNNYLLYSNSGTPAWTNTPTITGTNITGIPNTGLSNYTISGVALGSNLNNLTFGTHLTGNAYNGSTTVTIGTDATNANTISTIVARDSSGNFSAGTITANLTGTSSNIVNQGALATLNTINNGNWSGTQLSVGNGGTGQTTFTDGQLLIGNSTGNTLTPATLTGTSNEISVTNGHGTITLSTPQAIDSGASPTFAGLTLTGALSVFGISNTGAITSTATSTASAFVSTSATATSTIAGGLSVAGIGGLSVAGAFSAAGSGGLNVLSNGTVGIGTSSPFARLSVNGDGYFTGNVTASSFTSTSTTATSTIAGDITVGSGSAFVVDYAGNVGIGTSTPYAALSVVGSSGVVADHYVATSSTATSTFAAAITVGAGQGTSTFAGGLSASIFNATSATASSTFANGINLTKGCYAVNSTCLSTGGSSASSTLLSNNNTFSGINRFTNTTSSGGLFMPGGAYVASFAGGTWINLPTSGASGIGTGGPGSNPFLAYSASDGQWFSNAQTGDENFRNTSGNMNFGVQQANYDMSLRASSHILQLGMNGGDVGVATATPSYPFSVQGTSYFDNTMGINDPSLVAVGSPMVNAPNPTGTLVASANEDSSCTDNGGSYINGTVTYKLWAYRYNLGGTKIYSPNYITNTISDFSGNQFCGELSWTDVGADGYILEINSSVESGYPGIGYTDMGNITSYEDIGQGRDVYGAFPDSPTSSIISSAIFMGGNVGIGTTTPLQALSVTGNGYFSGSLTAMGALSVHGITDIGAITSTATSTASAFVATSTTATSTFAGAVGIGTSTPFAILSVQGGAGNTSPLFAVASTTGVTPAFQINSNGTFSANHTGATSTITGNLYVNGALRSTTSYNGDLIFANNFRITEASTTASTTPNGANGLYIKNQNDNSVLSIDENGNLTVAGDVCSSGTQCYGKSLSTLSSNVNALSSSAAFSGMSLNELNVSLSSTTRGLSDLSVRVDALSSTTAAVASSTLTIASSIAEIYLKLNDLTSTTAAFSSSTQAIFTASALEASSSFMSMIATSTASSIASSPSLVQVIVTAVLNALQSAENVIVQKITASFAVFTHVQTQTAAVTNGLEMTDSATGEIYCVRITNGDFAKTAGGCDSAASTTPAVTTAAQTVTTANDQIPNNDFQISSSTQISNSDSTSTVSNGGPTYLGPTSMTASTTANNQVTSSNNQTPAGSTSTVAPVDLTPTPTDSSVPAAPTTSNGGPTYLGPTSMTASTTANNQVTSSNNQTPAGSTSTVDPVDLTPTPTDSSVPAAPTTSNGGPTYLGPTSTTPAPAPVSAPALAPVAADDNSGGGQ